MKNFNLQRARKFSFNTYYDKLPLYDTSLEITINNKQAYLAEGPTGVVFTYKKPFTFYNDWFVGSKEMIAFYADEFYSGSTGEVVEEGKSLDEVNEEVLSEGGKILEIRMRTKKEILLDFNKTVKDTDEDAYFAYPYDGDVNKAYNMKSRQVVSVVNPAGWDKIIHDALTHHDLEIIYRTCANVSPSKLLDMMSNCEIVLGGVSDKGNYDGQIIHYTNLDKDGNRLYKKLVQTEFYIVSSKLEEDLVFPVFDHALKYCHIVGIFDKNKNFELR